MFNSTYHSFTAHLLTWVVSSLTLQEKFHLYVRPCIILYLLFNISLSVLTKISLPSSEIDLLNWFTSRYHSVKMKNDIHLLREIYRCNKHDTLKFDLALTLTKLLWREEFSMEMTSTLSFKVYMQQVIISKLYINHGMGTLSIRNKESIKSLKKVGLHCKRKTNLLYSVEKKLLWEESSFRMIVYERSRDFIDKTTTTN